MTNDRAVEGYLRHIRACRSAVLPGDRLRFLIGSVPTGWLKPGFADALKAFPTIRVEEKALVLDEPAALEGIAAELGRAGHYRCRGELFDVREVPTGPVLARIDRGALPSFGLLALGVHVNGLVRRPEGLHLWVGRRAPDKHMDPDKLDHLVAGGVPAGLTLEQTLEKEAQEEAGLPPDLARKAHPVAQIAYAMERAEGLRRDYLFCYDLDLPQDFVPRPIDGEVVAFELWPIERVMQTVRDTDNFKFNVNLVLIDLFRREGLIPEPAASTVRAALAAGRV